MYQVGRAERPEKDDPVCETLDAAMHEAHAQGEQNEDHVIAVWELLDHDAPYVVCLLYQRDVYKATY